MSTNYHDAVLTLRGHQPYVFNTFLTSLLEICQKCHDCSVRVHTLVRDKLAFETIFLTSLVKPVGYGLRKKTRASVFVTNASLSRRRVCGSPWHDTVISVWFTILLQRVARNSVLQCVVHDTMIIARPNQSCIFPSS